MKSCNALSFLQAQFSECRPDDNTHIHFGRVLFAISHWTFTSVTVFKTASSTSRKPSELSPCLAVWICMILFMMRGYFSKKPLGPEWTVEQGEYRDVQCELFLFCRNSLISTPFHSRTQSLKHRLYFAFDVDVIEAKISPCTLVKGREMNFEEFENVHYATHVASHSSMFAEGIAQAILGEIWSVCILLHVLCTPFRHSFSPPAHLLQSKGPETKIKVANGQIKQEAKMLLQIASVFGIQWGGWAVATVLRTEKFYDLTGELLLLTSLQHP